MGARTAGAARRSRREELAVGPDGVRGVEACSLIGAYRSEVGTLGLDLRDRGTEVAKSAPAARRAELCRHPCGRTRGGHRVAPLARRGALGRASRRRIRPAGHHPRLRLGQGRPGTAASESSARATRLSLRHCRTPPCAALRRQPPRRGQTAGASRTQAAAPQARPGRRGLAAVRRSDPRQREAARSRECWRVVIVAAALQPVGQRLAPLGVQDAEELAGPVKGVVEHGQPMRAGRTYRSNKPMVSARRRSRRAAQPEPARAWRTCPTGCRGWQDARADRRRAAHVPADCSAGPRSARRQSAGRSRADRQSSWRTHHASAIGACALQLRAPPRCAARALAAVTTCSLAPPSCSRRDAGARTAWSRSRWRRGLTPRSSPRRPKRCAPGRAQIRPSHRPSSG